MPFEKMTSSRENTVACLISCLMNIGVAFAQPTAVLPNEKKASSARPVASAEPLEITLLRRKVVVADGKEALQSATTAKPGEVLEDVVTYANKSASSLTGLEATLPIPPNTVLLLESIRPGNAKASTDGSRYASLPLTRKVRQANGVETEQAIPPGEYRYLRWYPGELAAGKSLVFSARFTVANDSASALQPAK